MTKYKYILVKWGWSEEKENTAHKCNKTKSGVYNIVDEFAAVFAGEGNEDIIVVG